MSTLLVAAVLVGLVAAVIFLLVSFDKKQKRNVMNQLLNAFSLTGSEHNMTFSSQEILKDAVIGLDGVHRKLLVMSRKEGNRFNALVIDLKEVKGCSVKKVYGTIHSGDLNVKKLEQYLETIALRFSFGDKPPVDIVFYHHIENHIYEVAELESKAKHWEAILSKMFVPVKKIA